MNYYFSKIIEGKSFDKVVETVTNELKTEGFGVLTEIDISATLKKKLNVDFKKYKILGACNPGFAYKALQTEDNIGVFLPCNVVVQEHKNNSVEVAFVDPVASMISVKNDSLATYAAEVKNKLKNVLNNLK